VDFSVNEGTLVVTAGTGEGFESAIVIKRIPKGLSAAGAEQLLLEQQLGRRHGRWSIVHSELVSRDARTFDVVRVAIGGVERDMYFDVTALLAGRT
jgi:hypothetical protein